MLVKAESKVKLHFGTKIPLQSLGVDSVLLMHSNWLNQIFLTTQE